ncbi:hypothetical protein M0657_011760 [Pyricularia oryzae]|nr:hypothetical protein M0657_011760 [Pyricularia oryzae]KAI7913878.1 hypothetical protein M9X92_009228 [Pyricularia oryzae]
MTMQLPGKPCLVCQVKLCKKEEDENGGRRGRSRQVVKAEGQKKRARRCVERRTVVLQRVRPAGSLFTSLGADVRCRRQIGPGRPHLTRIGIEQYNCGEGRRAKKNSGTSVLDGLSKDVVVFDTFSSP